MDVQVRQTPPGSGVPPHVAATRHAPPAHAAARHRVAACRAESPAVRRAARQLARTVQVQRRPQCVRCALRPTQRTVAGVQHGSPRRIDERRRPDPSGRRLPDKVVVVCDLEQGPAAGPVRNVDDVPDRRGPDGGFERLRDEPAEHPADRRPPRRLGLGHDPAQSRVGHLPDNSQPARLQPSERSHRGRHGRAGQDNTLAQARPARDDRLVLRVYLDQNKWVDLARAASGHRAGAPFVAALDVCRAAVEAGNALFPVDMHRYWETGKRADDRSRGDVVGVMTELSRGHTMALPFDLLDQEIDFALRRRYGRPAEPRRQQVFGMGMRHIVQDRIDWPEPDLDVLRGGAAAVAPGLRAQLSEAVGQIVEDELLRAGPHTWQQVGFDPRDSDHAERFVQFENSVAAAIAEHGLTGDMVDLAVRGVDLGDIRVPLEQALGRIGITYDEFVEHEGLGLVSFIDDLPTRYVTNVLRSAKHRQKQAWEPNDFVDVVALPVAAVYCDAVVTEKQWVHMMRNGDVERRYSTQLLSDTAGLVDVVVAASVT